MNAKSSHSIVPQGEFNLLNTIEEAIFPFTDPNRVLISIFKRQVLTLLIMTGFYRDRSTYTLPPEMTYQVIYFLIYCAPQRAVDPIRGTRQIFVKVPPRMAGDYICGFRVFGSSILNHFSRRQIPVSDLSLGDSEDSHSSTKMKWVGGNHYPSDWDLLANGVHRENEILEEFFRGHVKNQKTIIDTIGGKVHEVSYGPWHFNLVKFRRDTDLTIDIEECYICYSPLDDRFESIYGDIKEFPKSWRMNKLHYKWVPPDRIRSLGCRDMDFKKLISMLRDGKVVIDDRIIDTYLILQNKRRDKYKRFCEINDLEMVIDIIDQEKDIKNMITFRRIYFGQTETCIKWL